MPQLVPALTNIAINLAVGVGLSLLSNLIKPKAASQSATQADRGFSFDMEVGESVPVRAMLGLGRSSGQLVYVNEYGVGADYHLQMVIKIGHGWHEGLDTFLVDDAPAALAGSNGDPKGRSVVPFTVGGVPYMWVKYYTGAPGQVADPELIANAQPAGRWTSAHRGTGCAYMIVTVRNNADLYPGALPRFGSVWKGLRLYDWRQPGQIWGDQSTYAFTKNPAVIRYNFRRGIYANGVRVLGMGLSPFANDMAYYTAAANVCDEPISYPETGTTLARYEFGREVGDDEEKLSVLNQLDDSYCGSSFKRGGADAPIPAHQLVSMMTLTDKDRLHYDDGRPYPVRADRKGSVSQKRTAWHGQFVSADVGYGMAPFVPRINAALESSLGGRRSVALDQSYEVHQERAQARAEIALRRQFYPATRVETFGPIALALEPGDAITRDCEWGSMLMVVEKVAQTEDRTGATVTMTQWSNLIVPASGDHFITLPADPGANAAAADRTIAVSSLAVVAYSMNGGGSVHPFGRATWEQITDPNVAQVMIRLWPTAGTEATDKLDFFADSKLTSAKIVGPLQPATTYSYKAIPVRNDNRTCIWSGIDTFTTGSESVPPNLDLYPVNLAQLDADVRVWQQNMGDSIRDAREAIQRINLLVGNFASRDRLDKQTLRQDLGAAIDGNTARWSYEVNLLAAQDIVFGSRIEAIELTLPTLATLALTNVLQGEIATVDGKVTANAVAITDLMGTVGYDSGQATFRMGIGYTPSAGWTSSIGLQARASAGSAWRTAGLYFEATATLARVVVDADQFVVRAGGTVAAMFDSAGAMIKDLKTGTITGPGGYSFWNLSTGAFRIST